ncbi:hypothetical protein ACJJTC_011332 [Scirpophaga incertulas]
MRLSTFRMNPTYAPGSRWSEQFATPYISFMSGIDLTSAVLSLRRQGLGLLRPKTILTLRRLLWGGFPPILYCMTNMSVVASSSHSLRQSHLAPTGPYTTRPRRHVMPDQWESIRLICLVEDFSQFSPSPN